MDYQIIAPDAALSILWNEATIAKLAGGFKLDKTNLRSDLTILPKGALLNLNFSTRIATLVKCAKVYEELAGDGTALKVYKTNQFVAGEFIGYNGVSVAISAVDTTNALYDLITLGAALSASAIPVGSVLFEDDAAAASDAVPKVLGTAMNYVDVEITSTNTVSVTAIIQAYEIKEANLPYPVHADHKVSLTSRFMFV